MTSTAPPDLPPARRKADASLAEQAYAVLRRAIITGEMPGGTEVSEPELAERLGMSKTPVREALARLAVEGLVGAYPRRGYRVTPVTVPAINDLFAVRAALEGAAASAAARRLTEEVAARLEALAHASSTPGGAQGVFDANHAFHMAVAEAACNPRLTALIRAHLEEGERYFHLGRKGREVEVKTNSEHFSILAALRGGDAEAARREMAAHVENTRRGLLRALLDGAENDLAF
ncbi:GntR family transcriptional regulator [Roseomonas sp. GC11]|uniref:GntR family transcriptional regulator n=1 Tax=Roseomonas sp. GC11 TaxID=2950546 RepID=UPI00210E7280|nr:GntR family transcriptional regulator [Roseomonas sp. GC11]MCQ4160109.1 GntR family transcriptional regulator [Roseomonas sp. GC11]